MTSYHNHYIGRYLNTAIDMRTYRIAVEAFSKSSFFEDFTLEVSLKGSRKAAKKYPQLQSYEFVENSPRQNRVLLARTANCFFSQWM